MGQPTSPSDDELKSALTGIKTANPSLGISKVHALLLANNPDWIVSEKRTRKILQSENLIVSSADKIISPSSKVIPDLDVTKWTTKVQVKYFNKQRGKGLVATELISPGETIWKEDPFTIAAESMVYEAQVTSKACNYCTTPITESNLTTGCPASTSSQFCPARYCNRLCLTRSAKHHAFLCPAQNPASILLLKHARELQWMGLHAVAQYTSRLLLAFQSDQAAFEKDWQFLKSLAELGMAERIRNGKSEVTETETNNWKQAHSLYLQAFKSPKSATEQKKLNRLLKKPLTPELEKELFDYESFSRGLGRMGLNLESHGGLYVLHSHLNHSCAPNVSIRHIDQQSARSRITAIAIKDIQPGEELLITYINPESGLKWRREQLRPWGFGDCMCARCVEEAKSYKEEPVKAIDDRDLSDLKKELKAGFGVV